jgi:putative ABC transport system permease protein
MRALESLGQDLRYAVRILRRAPGFTAVVVLLLAVGIGANTAIFSLINVLMLRELPVRDPHQLVELLSRYPGEPRMNGFSWKIYEHFREQSHVFSDLIGSAPSSFEASGQGRDSETINGRYVTGNFFEALGLQPAIGRLIGPKDDQSGGEDPAVVVVSWPYWQRRFNRDPSILTQRMVLDGVSVAVIGVAPREFFGLQVGLTPDLWVPAALRPTIVPPSGEADRRPGLQLMARLKPGASLSQAHAEMRVLDRLRVEEIAQNSRDPLWRQATIEVAPAAAGFSPLRDQIGRQLLVLMGVVVLLLLLTCTNVASMMLARGASRRREMATRVALGADRVRLMRQVLAESLLLSGAGGLLGVLLAYAGAGALVRSLPLDLRMARGQTFGIDARPDPYVLLVIAGVALLTGVLFGMTPAWNAFAPASASSLREIGGAAETRSRRLFGQGLIVAQVALSVVLLSAAGLFVRHVSSLRLDLGFERNSVLLLTLDPSRSRYQRDQLAGLYQDLLGRLHTIPGVRSATLSALTPIDPGAASRFATVEGFEEKPEDRRYLSLNWVAPRYFETIGTPLVAGRDFEFQDETGPRVAIVNRAMARHYFGDSTALGRRLAFDGQSHKYEIVGVVGDAKYDEIRAAAPRMVYLHAFQEARGRHSKFALRTERAPANFVGPVRMAVRDVLKTVPIAKVTTLAEQVDAAIVRERLMAKLSGAFGGLGAVLAALGLYGVLAYTVARRTTEIGIRMALGATRSDVTGMVLKNALTLVCAGLVAGAPVAVWSQRFAASQIENLQVETAVPIAVAAAATIGLGLIAAYVPARRAARVQPMEALRRS